VAVPAVRVTRESRFYLSLEDELMRIFATGAIQWVMGKDWPDDVSRSRRRWSPRPSSGPRTRSRPLRAQREIRKNVLKYDEVMNEQRKKFGLTTYLFHIRRLWLDEIDSQWIAHLKNIEHLRTGIGLVGYATRNPKNEYKLRGYNLFKEMWEGIELTVLDKVINMALTEAERRQAEEGAEYETALTRANDRQRGAAPARRAAGQAQQLDKLQEAARKAMEQLQAAQHAGAAASAAEIAAAADEAAEAAVKAAVADKEVPKVRPNDPCPCGSGKRYKKCHGQAREARDKKPAGAGSDGEAAAPDDAREESAAT
jgi:preprotein translocase subunit SecA